MFECLILGRPPKNLQGSTKSTLTGAKWQVLLGSTIWRTPAVLESLNPVPSKKGLALGITASSLRKLGEEPVSKDTCNASRRTKCAANF